MYFVLFKIDTSINNITGVDHEELIEFELLLDELIMLHTIYTVI